MQLIVLGMHRSGTSVLARLLNMMGAYFGPEGASTGANKENPKGFWERRDVRDLNDFVLHSVDCDWNKVASFDPRKIPDTVVSKFGDRAANIVLELDAHRPWLLKEPRLCLLLEKWKEFLEVPVCIHIHRNPVEVAQSLNKRNGIPVHTGIALWEKYNQSALEASSGLRRFVVSHNRLMQSPEKEVKFIYEQLLSFAVRGLHLPTNREITSFVRNELYRNRANDIDLGQYLNSAQLTMFEEFSGGGILEERDHYPLSDSCLPMLSEYEVSEESKKAAEEAQQAASQRETELEKKLAKQEQSLSQQAKAAEEAQQAASQRETELEKKLAKQEQSLSQQAKAAEEAQQAASQRETELENRLESRDQKIANIENELLLQRQAKNDAIKLGEKRLHDINQLIRWIHIIEFHLSSPRWRSGRSALGVMAKAIGKRKADIENDQLFSVLKKFKIWKGVSEQSQVSASGKEHDRHQELIKNSGLFDESWYLERNPDVKESGTNPLEHFIRYGWKENRNPGPGFDTKLYLQSNPDVAQADISPLEHFILYGQEEGRAPKPMDTITVHRDYGESVDVVVTVFNALEDVKKCLNALKTRRDGFPVNVIVVSDGSGKETSDWLKSFCSLNEKFTLIEHSKNKGYTTAVNTGLKASSAPYVVLLNSDTMVTHGWLKGLIRCVNSDKQIGIVGPLSNAATWQNVPNLYDDSGNFAVNELPNSMTPDDMARSIATASNQLYPRQPFVNGFCFLIRRQVIEAIGFMDEENFPVGYGEENDYCIRAGDAGFELAVADDAYVFHSKSKSFGHERRKELSKQGSDAIKRKHTESKFKALVEQVKNTEILDEVRANLKNEIETSPTRKRFADFRKLKVVFLLPVKGGSGGAHSVVQEVTEMRRLGVAAKIGVKLEHRPRLLKIYRDIENVDGLFVAFTPDNIVKVMSKFDIVVGTIFNSMVLVKQIVEVNPHILPAYYIQDYEPLFFPEDSKNWHEARASYNLVPGAILFAKTNWIANMVEQEHGVTVHKVSPSIDHAVYNPASRKESGKIRISAMIRPQTPRRGAQRTMRLLSRLADAFPDQVKISLFGCNESNSSFNLLQRDFKYENLGVLTRPQVASLLRRSDLFVDLSDYQAFGRTALEAMACGCAAVVPVHGGTDEYAIDGSNAIVVDSFDEEVCFKRVAALIKDDKKLSELKKEALITAKCFSVENAALSELGLFEKFLSKHRKVFPVKEKRKLFLIHSLQENDQSAHSEYQRVLLPYNTPEIWKDWEVVECSIAHLPEIEKDAVAIIHGGFQSSQKTELKPWLKAWLRGGGKLIYDVHEDTFGKSRRSENKPVIDLNELNEKAKWYVKKADLVTTATEKIRDTLVELNSNVILVPETLDSKIWQFGAARKTNNGWVRRSKPDATYIGYIGDESDLHDLKLITEVMNRIKKEYGEKVEIEVIGTFQNKTPLFGKRVGLPRDRSYPEYCDWLQRRVDWDIGVIPMHEGDSSSSDRMKFIELAALDAAVVCSNLEAPNSMVQHEKNALVVKNTVDSWYASLKDLIDNPNKRIRLAENASSDVHSQFVVENSSTVYTTTLNAAVNQ